MQRVRTMSVVALSLVALAGTPASAQFGPMEAEVGSAIEAVAVLTLEQTVIDLGTISDDEAKPMKVGFKNTGTGTLTIADLKGSCGCTVPQLEKKEYKPGEGGVIDITYNPHGKRDQQQTTVTITSNDPSKSVQTVTVKSIVKPNVFWDPQAIAFNQVGKGKGGKMLLKVTGRLENFAVTEVTATNPEAFEAKVIETKAIEQADGKPGFESTVEVTLKPNTPVGMAQANLTLRTTNSKNPLVNVSTFAEVTGDLATTPIKFFLNQLQVDQDLSGGVSNKVILRHKEGKPFKVTKFEVVRMPNGLEHTFTAEVKPEDATGSAYAITLLGKVPNVAGPVQGDVVLTTDIPGEESVKIGYFGMIAGSQAGAPQAGAVPSGAPSIKGDPRGAGAVIGKPMANPTTAVPLKKGG